MNAFSSHGSQGFFIVFEGGEGSGKSSLAEICAKFLRSRGRKVVTTHEPGATTLGTQLRAMMLESNTQRSPLDPKTELFLFLADRAQHVAEVIYPALQRGDVVICDRFVGSTLAYQGGGRTITDDDLLHAMNTFATQGVMPNIVVYLDVNPRVGLARKHQQGAHLLNRMEQEDLAFHDRVRAAFQQLAQKNKHWVTIDANQPLEKVTENVLSIFKKYNA